MINEIREQKMFGMIEEVWQTGANSSTKQIVEKSESVMRDSGWEREQEFKDFIANAVPGEYINFRGCIPIFRIR